MFLNRRKLLVGTCATAIAMVMKRGLAADRPQGLLDVAISTAKPVWQAAVAATGANDLTLTSPNNYPIVTTAYPNTVNCTYFCDAIAYTKNWKLQFSSKGDAKYWASRVTNANVSRVPTVDSIMVLDGWAGNSFGHVGWVKTVTYNNSNGSYTIYVKEGFEKETPLGKVNGKYDYYGHYWTISGGSAPTAKINNGSINITVKGFLSPK